MHGAWALQRVSGSHRNEFDVRSRGIAPWTGRIVPTRMKACGPTETRRGEDRSSGEHGREHDACVGCGRGRGEVRTRR